MTELNVLAVLVATVACFAIGAVYYGILGDRLAEVRGSAAPESRPLPMTLAVEVLRCLVLAAVVAGLAGAARVETWTGGLLLGLVLWVGFPLVLWVGAIVHENTPWRLAAIHGGDWLLKLLAVGVVVSIWP
jgi:amino acid permease